MLEACIDLESEPELVRVARRFVEQAVREWELDPVRDDALLITTELVANAVLHARTAVRVTLRSDGFGFLRIEVRDDNSRMPVPSAPLDGATSGRGLAVVSALSATWGTQADDTGKVVWAEIGRATRGDHDTECLGFDDFASID